MKSFFGGWSKKLTGFLVTIAVIVLNKKLDLGLTENDIYAVTGGFGAYAVGQGLTDLGKSKAIIENGFLKSKS